MGIKDWPAVERPREKLLARGAQALSDAELLAIFISSGVAGHSAVDLARLLLARFGGGPDRLRFSRPSNARPSPAPASRYCSASAGCE